MFTTPMQEYAERVRQRKRVCGTTACFPGLSLSGAVEKLLAGASERGFGTINTSELQLCPQNFGPLDEALCDKLTSLAPATKFRLHANTRVLPRHHMLDASTFNDDTKSYYEVLADRSHRLGARGYSLHAGHRANATLDQMRDAVLRLNDLFDNDTLVGVEGLYPNDKCPQLIDSWKEYAWLLNAGIPFAIDISHLKIVATAEGCWHQGLVNALLGHALCIEVHVSDNDGRRDQHRTVAPSGSITIGMQSTPAFDPWTIEWTDLFQAIPERVVIFTEGNQLKDARPTKQSRPAMDS